MDKDLFKPAGPPPELAIIDLAFFGTEISKAMDEVETLSGFRLKSEAVAPFVNFRIWIGTRPHFVDEWRSDPQTEQSKYLRMMNGVESSQRAFEACAYHLSNIRSYQSEVRALFAKVDFSAIPKGTVVGAGGTQKIDFEYQAFVLAARRSLDHLAWGLSTYFELTHDSFNDFTKKSVEKYHPREVAEPVGLACRDHRPKFDYIIGNEKGRSLRDRIAHRDAVQAGVINLNRNGFRFMGGAENLGKSDPRNPPLLTDLLVQRMHDLRDCYCEVLNTFQRSVAKFEAN